MNKNNDTVNDFVKSFNELQNSYREVFNNKSFDKNLISKNIALVKNKRYAITDEIWDIDEEFNIKYLSSLLDIIKQFAKEYQNDIESFKNIFDEKDSFSKEFILDVLTNKQKKLIDFARNNNITNDFLTFFAIFSAYPYRKAVADLIKTEINLEEHISGFCPVCGHWPGMSYILGKEGKKIMSCICCGTHWSFRRMKCSFCLTSDKDALGYLNVEGEDEISAYICDKCRRYLKTKKIEKDTIDFSKNLPIVDYMCSGYIDIASLQNKYLQEPILGTRFNGPNDKHIELYLEKLK